MSTETPVPGERAAASVAGGQSRANRLQRRLALATAALSGMVVLGWYYVHLLTTSRAEGVQRANATRGAASSEMRLPALDAGGGAAARRDGRVAAPADSASLGADPIAQRERPPATQVAGFAPEARARLPRSANSPVLIQQTAGAAPAVSRAVEVDDPRLDELRRLVAPPEHASPAAAAAPALADALVPTVTAPAQAALAVTRRWLLPKGSFLDCTLETAIDSTLPGLATCVLAVDAFGADGRVVLLERGTKLVGETRSEVRSGQARVAVVWSEARTPTGVVVALASPGTDALGRAGVPGAVDNHLAARFGAAVLLSIIDGAISGFVAHEQGSAGVIYNPQGSRDIAADALRNTIGIPPTVNVPAGARVQVLVARDVDFRGVYRLASRADR